MKSVLFFVVVEPETRDYTKRDRINLYFVGKIILNTKIMYQLQANPTVMFFHSLHWLLNLRFAHFPFQVKEF